MVVHVTKKKEANELNKNEINKSLCYNANTDRYGTTGSTEHIHSIIRSFVRLLKTRKWNVKCKG